MGSRQLSPGARAYVFLVIAAGAIVGARLLAGAAPLSWDWRPIGLFGALSILASAVSVTYQGYLPSRIVHQISSSFAYVLFFLVDPGAVCLVLWVMTAADWAFNRRRLLTAVFNMGQLSLALWAAFAVRGLIRPDFVRLDGVDARTMAAAVASLVAFSVVNQALTYAVMSLASRRPFFRLGVVTWSGLLNEVLCITSGIGMAVFWWVSPGLALLGVIPIWLLVVLLILLSRREQELESRQTELSSLQGLGLEIGAELDAERLRRAVVRMAPEALMASGAILAVLDPTRENLLVEAHEGVHPAPPPRLRLSRPADGFFESGKVHLIQDFPSERHRYPELSFLDASGILCAPLEIQGRRSGLLIVFHGARRRPFDEEDVRRLQTLVRFVDVALSNAQLVAELKDMQTQLVHTEKMSALGMLVSGVAHELNNPLTSVVGFAQLLLGREPDPNKRAMLEKILREGERAGKIVQNLLVFSRKHKPEKKLSDINEVLAQVLELRVYDLRVHNIKLVRRLAPDPPPVLADPHQLQQVFLNLITNAEQAIKQKGVEGRIVVETENRGEWVRVVVSDNGTGIPAANLKKVFLPFFTSKEVGKGTGLGLSICYGIVQEHGGRIDVVSREGEGASFIVDIPVGRTAGEPIAVGGADASPGVPTLATGRLLVVDDEEAITDLVRDTFEPQGWSVRSARDGVEALELIGDLDFDALLVDLRMPGMDGRRFYEALRETRPELARRVVFSTGDAVSEDTVPFLEAIENPVLGKPYNLRDLVDVVSRVASRSSSVH